MSPASTTKSARASGGANGACSRCTSEQICMRKGPAPDETRESSALPPPLRRDAHSQRVELDEAGGVGLIVCAAVFLESGDGGVEERVLVGLAADDGDVALVELQAHAAVHAGLRSVDHALEHFPLRAPPVAVVDEARVARHQLVLQVRDLAVEADRFDRA